jgi:hypothetical protein
MRRKELKEKRDREIVKKFYELYDKKRMRMDDVLKELSEKHFFLDTNYIYSIIFYNKENNDYYNHLIENK